MDNEQLIDSLTGWVDFVSDANLKERLLEAADRIAALERELELSQSFHKVAVQQRDRNQRELEQAERERDEYKRTADGLAKRAGNAEAAHFETEELLCKIFDRFGIEREHPHFDTDVVIEMFEQLGRDFKAAEQRAQELQDKITASTGEDIAAEIAGQEREIARLKAEVETKSALAKQLTRILKVVRKQLGITEMLSEKEYKKAIRDRLKAEVDFYEQPRIDWEAKYNKLAEQLQPGGNTAEGGIVMSIETESKYTLGELLATMDCISDAMWGGELGWTKVPPEEFRQNIWDFIARLQAEIERLKIWGSDSHVTDLEAEVERLKGLFMDANQAKRNYADSHEKQRMEIVKLKAAAAVAVSDSVREFSEWLSDEIQGTERKLAEGEWGAWIDDLARHVADNAPPDNETLNRALGVPDKTGPWFGGDEGTSNTPPDNGEKG
jgi:hypothetical protein